MFSLHETTRKRTCRTAFFALCLAPTCATAAWIADHCLPWRDAAAARRLSDRYHLEVTLADLQEPRPNVTRLASATLAEPGVAAPFLKLTGVETHRHGDALIISLEEATLAIADLPTLAARFDWLLSRTPAAKIELRIERLALAASHDAPAVALHQLRGVIQRNESAPPRLQAIAHLTENPSADAKPIGFSCELAAATPDANEAKQTEPAPPHQVVTFTTQQNAIPAALLAPFVPGIGALNNTATFAGVVTWRAHVADVTGELSGRLEGVDLAGILPGNSPHKLTGAAAIELTDCHWQGEQFQRLAGALTSADAAANGSLLVAARAYLGSKIGDGFKELQAAAARVSAQQLPTTEDRDVTAANHELTHLACRFTLDAAGLVVEPNIPAASTLPAGTLAAIDGQTVLFCPRPADGKILPAVAWLQFVASPPIAWIPFTPEVLETARRLPPPQ